MPVLEYTDFDTSNLEYCKTEDGAREIINLVYDFAQKTQNELLCGQLCNRTVYEFRLNMLSKRVLSKELNKYGDGYFIIWPFYSSLYVIERIETYVYDFDTTLSSVGGSMSIFLGWSMYSILMSVIEFAYEHFCTKQESMSSHSNVKLMFVE